MPLIRENAYYSKASYDDWMATFFSYDFSRHSKTKDFHRFRKVFQAILQRSGEPLNLTTLAAKAGVNRKMASAIVHRLADLCAVSLLEPYHHEEPSQPGREATSTPLLYACDTGLVCRVMGWNEDDDDLKNHLWRHVVLEYLQAQGKAEIGYWRGTRGDRIDFVVRRASGAVDAVLCRWGNDTQESDFLAVKAFRAVHPQGTNYLLTSQDPLPSSRKQERHGKTVHLRELSEFGSHPVNGDGASRRLRAPIGGRPAGDSE